jgi:cytochrome c553
MTKAERGLSRQDLRKYRPDAFNGLTRWLFAGLVMIATSGIMSVRVASAQGNSPPVATTASKGAGAISETARNTAASLFGDRCAVCHGANGDGKGPGAENLNPKPVDFRARKWQRSVTDEKIAKAIVYGGPAVGLSSSMSANPDLETQPGVVAALVEHIRSLAGK